MRPLPVVADLEEGISLEGLHVSPCLAGFSLSVAAGERLAVIGRNGTGKSTLLRCIAGLSTLEGGRARAPGPFGYVPQDFRSSLLPWMRGRDNILLPLRSRQLSDAEMGHRLAGVLAAVALAPPAADRYPYELSGGEQQQLALARALVGEPTTLLLDEPFSALDLTARSHLRRTLTPVGGRRGPTLVLVSHDPDDVAALAERVVVVGGRPLCIQSDVALGDGGADRLSAAFEQASGAAR